jgi:tetratricopeptide (TPR) repeat protein
VTEDAHAIAQAIEMLAHIYVELGRAREALELLDESEPLIRGTGSSPEVAHFRLERARALAVAGDREDAAALAMQLAGELADIQPVARGRAYLLLGDVFRELYELAVECLEPQPPSKHLVSAHQALAELLKRQGDPDAALELLERALAVRARAGHRLGTTD